MRPCIIWRIIKIKEIKEDAIRHGHFLLLLLFLGPFLESPDN